MSNSGHYMENAIEAAKKAVQFDQQGEGNIAAYYYEASAHLLTQAIPNSEPELQESLKDKADQYRNRAVELRSKTPEDCNLSEDTNRTQLKQCYFLLQQAMDEDEHGEKEDAIELYVKAVEYITQYPELMQGDLKSLVLQALERAEELKGNFYYNFVHHLRAQALQLNVLE